MRLIISEFEDSMILGVDACSILFKHRSFQESDPFPQVDGFLKRNSAPWVKNGNGG